MYLRFNVIHLVVCLTTGPKPLPKRALHIVRSRTFSLKWEYPLFSLRSSNSFLRLLPCLPLTSIPPCIFPSITRCRRQFLRKMWPIQFAFRLRISCRILLCSLTLSNTPSFLTWSVKTVICRYITPLLLFNPCLMMTRKSLYKISNEEIIRTNPINSSDIQSNNTS